MPGKLRDAWGKWRESRRQYQLERALYKMNGGATGAFASQERAWNSDLAAGVDTTRIEAPKGKAPDPPAGVDTTRIEAPKGKAPDPPAAK